MIPLSETGRLHLRLSPDTHTKRAVPPGSSNRPGVRAASPRPMRLQKDPEKKLIPAT